MIPYGRQKITRADIDAVIEVLESDFITQGPKVPEFEKAVTHKTGAGHAVAANSATSALHLACRALDVGPGDTVWTPPITFVASANCALYCGAKIDFVDIDPQTANMSPKALQEKLALAERSGKLPKAVIPVHMCGQPCDMSSIAELAAQYKFKIIEDASHAIGARYKNEPVGNCRYSDITVFSFHPVKIITTGEGGMILTNQEELAERMRLLSSHSITRDPRLMTKEPEGPWYYEQIDLGYNYRMTDIQAALGLSQLQRLDKFVSRRNKLARRYDHILADLPVTTPRQHPDTYSAWHLYVIRLNLGNLASSRREVFDYLRDQGIGVNVHYIPVHTQPYYRRMGFEWGMFPEAEQYYQEAITLPLFPAMTGEEQDRVVDALKDILSTEHL
ncbi:MAG: UDP-4-amino-4,6-dideoxy-N-acetyl-beta-L-altrosamine transaminase [Desulfobacterales bacterium]